MRNANFTFETVSPFYAQREPLSSDTGYKPWAWLTNEQRRNVIGQLEKGLTEMDAPTKVITRPEYMDQYYQFFTFSDGGVYVTKRR